MTATVPQVHRGAVRTDDRARAAVLLLAYLLGCAVVAAVLALGLAAVWQEFFGWAGPYITPDRLPG